MENNSRLSRGEREAPAKRSSINTHVFSISGFEFCLHCEEYVDGRLSGINIETNYRCPEFMRAILKIHSQCISVAIQHGTPLEAILDNGLFTKFEPSGLAKGDAVLPYASSVIDYIYRYLGIHYLGMNNLAYLDSDHLAQIEKQPAPNRPTLTLIASRETSRNPE